MPAIVRKLHPGESVFGGGAGIIPLGRRPAAPAPTMQRMSDDPPYGCDLLVWWLEKMDRENAARAAAEADTPERPE